ncbi:MAG: hypothetical protein ACOC0P_06480 [Planctomycetota bacterium]
MDPSPEFVWRIGDLADAVAEGLARASAAVEEEQAVRGIDALDELELHPLLHDTFAQAGYGVHPEQRFPRDRRRRNKRSEGERCDIVLTPDGRPLAEEAALTTLFTPAGAVDLPDAFWLEVKTTGQFIEGGPNHRYAAELQQPVRRDVRKLAADPEILHAGVLLVLFAALEEIARQDLSTWQSKCLANGLPVGTPAIRTIPVGDRLGNTCAVIAVFPVHHL